MHKPRRQYVSRACVNCRLRKVKCSGERPCQRCSSSDEACEYVASRRGYEKHRRMAKEQDAQASMLAAHPSYQPSPRRQFIAPTQHHVSLGSLAFDSRESQLDDDDPEVVARELQMLSRTPRVFANDLQSCPTAGSEISTRDSGQSPSMVHGRRSSHYTNMLDNITGAIGSIGESPHRGHFDRDDNIAEAGEESQDHTTLSKTIEVLDSTVRANPQSNLSLTSGKHNLEFEEMTNAPSPEHNIIMCNVASLRHAFTIYFTYIIPNLPFLNENQFRAQFENHLVTGGRETDAWSKDIFVVLVNLIYAETMLLDSEFPDSNSIPGWPEFCFADRVLRRLPWLNRGNLQLIQCLLIKVRILATTQRMRSAYDTVSRAVQICFHIGLHDQSSWGDLTPFETAMRHRVFWSLFYLDRGISYSVGLPYLLRESDFNVDLPKSIDDKAMFANRPLPEEGPTSYVPYLLGLVSWSRLSSKIWDSMFNVNAPKPASEDLIASLDSEILHHSSQLPPSLWWDPLAFKSEKNDDIPPYMRRQMCLMHLHTNHLRLSMRTKSIVTLKASRKVAEESVWIAKSSVDAVEDFRTCCLPYQYHRYSSVMYLTISIIPLICVIIQENESPVNTQAPREEVVESFLKALAMLQDIASGFALARLMLSRLDAAVTVAKNVIEPNSNEKNLEVDHDSGIEGIIDVGVSRGLLDLFRDLEKPPNETVGTHDSLFWTEDNELGLGDMDPNLFMNNPFDWYTSAPIV